MVRAEKNMSCRLRKSRAKSRKKFREDTTADQFAAQEYGIGQTVEIIPLFNEANRRVCCNLLDCQEILLNDFKKEGFVQPYNGTDSIWGKTSFQDSRYNASDYIRNFYLNMKTIPSFDLLALTTQLSYSPIGLYPWKNVVNDMKQFTYIS
uniref:Uncharacterized protein n=1 Tax=Ditylenchus dipsaci TaxID=166011 RepID=A0A915D7M0_9BILA